MSKAMTTKTSSWANRYYEQGITINADQVEFSALLNETASIRVGAADERIADALEDFENDESGDLEHWANDDIRLDNVDGKTIEEIERRAKLLGTLYPFQLEKGSLRYRPPENNILLYEALLCISQAKNLTTKRYKYLPRHFESLACIVSEIYLGQDASSKRTGWPRGKNEPKRLKGLIAEIREMTGDMAGEWRWKPREGLPDDPSPRDVKECGLDLVAWKRSIDKRTGQLYLLGQCACGKDWLDDSKLSELRYKSIDDWVERFNIRPVYAFFTPWHAIDEVVQHASKKAGLFFDRARIVLYAANDVRIKNAVSQSVIKHVIEIVQPEAA